MYQPSGHRWEIRWPLGCLPGGNSRQLAQQPWASRLPQGIGWAWRGDLGTWSFGVLPVSTAVLTFRRESGPVLPASSTLGSASKQRLVAYPTRAGLGIWAQPAWLAVGKEVAGDSTRRTKQYPQAMVGLAGASATQALCFLGIYLLC